MTAGLTKASPHGTDRDGRRRLRSTVAALANTDSGFLMIGVRACQRHRW